MSKEHPMLFDAESVRGVLGGYKFRTCRQITAHNSTCPGLSRKKLAQQIGRAVCAYRTDTPGCDGLCVLMADGEHIITPRIVPGDTIWGKETYRAEELDPYGKDGVRYRADNAFRMIECTEDAADAWLAIRNQEHPEHWRPSIYMPRWASRITLRVTAVVAQRARELLPREIIAEGAPANTHSIAWALRDWWHERLDGTNPKTRPWQNNVWCWGYEWELPIALLRDEL